MQLHWIVRQLSPILQHKTSLLINCFIPCPPLFFFFFFLFFSGRPAMPCDLGAFPIALQCAAAVRFGGSLSMDHVNPGLGLHLSGFPDPRFTYHSYCVAATL
jgi:hypothetical protein